MTQDARPTGTDRRTGGGGMSTRDAAAPGTEVLFLGGLMAVFIRAYGSCHSQAPAIQGSQGRSRTSDRKPL